MARPAVEATPGKTVKENGKITGLKPNAKKEDYTNVNYACPESWHLHTGAIKKELCEIKN